jgi:tRNA U34 2-thiouridine synthase MnmA/TrmU
MPSAVALFSGGLDSTLAIRILQEQGFEVEALNIRTTFTCCKTPAAQAAAELGVRLTVLAVADDYVNLIRQPAYGYGKGMNPCVDCRIYMAQMARRFMEEVGACVVATGEILGQRPMSQKRHHLDIIAKRSGLEGRLLRPLSAKLLPPTIPETEGLIDRERLYDFYGRERTPLVELAEQLGVRSIPQPSTGCALTELTFAPRVRDLLQHQPGATRPHFELLNIGRHIRIDDQTKAVVGRDEQENAWLEQFFAVEKPEQTVLLYPENFVGPVALVVGRTDWPACQLVGALVVRYTRQVDAANAQVQLRRVDGPTELVRIEPSQAVPDARPL